MLNAAQHVILTEDTAVELNGVSKKYIQWQRSGKIKDLMKNLFSPDTKEIYALHDVSLSIRKGEFVAYAGANGAGKSTTIKMLSGILEASDGEIRVLGLNPIKSRIELMKRIGIVFGQRTELWWDQPVEVSFDWKRVVWDIPFEQFNRTKKEIIELLGLDEIMNTFARELSLGQRMRADLGLMLLHSPEMILLDEPTLGLDVLAKRQMIEFLKRLNKEQGTTIVVTSHDMDDLEEMANRIILLSKGRIAFDGNFDQLRSKTGSLRRIRLTTAEGNIPLIKNVELLSKKGHTFEYQFNACDVSMTELLYEISQLKGVIDIETAKAPIEQVIAGLYSQWKS